MAGSRGPNGKRKNEIPLAPLVPSIVLSPEERAAKAAIEKTDAEKRLQEAERRLRVAIEELHKGNEQASAWGVLFNARHPLCQHGDSCVANAVGSLCQSFLLAYGVRVGIGVLLRAFKLIRNRPILSVLDLQLLLSEKNLIIREEACRNGLLFGGFTGLYHAVRCMLRRMKGRETPSNAVVAGCIASLSVMSLDDRSKRRTFALYLLARVAQCAYNSGKAKGKFQMWGGQLRHGSTLLFSLASAQIMYAYVMRPETLPESYLDFIVRTGPIAKPVLDAVRRSCRGVGIDVAAVSEYVKRQSKGTATVKIDSMLPIIPCSIMHPASQTCLRHNGKAMQDTFRKTFPLYISLTLVPFVVLNLHKFMQAPFMTAWTATRSAVRSTTFISVFVGIYQAIICMQRNVSQRDHKLIYWFAGLGAGLSALLEKPGRRTELALYTLPRAADSLWYILVNRHLLPDIRHAEVVLFSACMGALMYYHEYEPQTMAPFLRGIITRFLNRTGFPLSDPSMAPLISPGSFPNLRAFHRPPDEVWPPEAELDFLLGETTDKTKDKGRWGKSAAGNGQGGSGPSSGEDRLSMRDRARLEAEKAVEKLKAEAFQGL